MGARAIRVVVASIFLLSLLGSALFIAPVARAATFTVANLNDTGAGSLRQALANAAAAAGPDTISFQVGLSGTIILANTLTINQDVTITGPGAGNLTISGNNAVRVFTISGGTVNIDRVRVTKGRDSAGSALLVDGGSAVTVSNSTVTANATGGCCALGGAVQVINGSTLTLNAATVSSNTDNYYRNGIAVSEGTLNLNNSTVTGHGGIGAVFAEASSTINLSSSVITANTATGVWVTASTLNIANSTISANQNNGNDGGVYIGGNSTALISGTTISGNKSSYRTGAILVSGSTATIVNSTISGNSAVLEAGALLTNGGATEVNLRFVTITGNVADNDNDGSGDGGGIYRDGGLVNIQSSIVAGNIDKGGQKNDCVGALTSQGNNLFGAGADCVPSSTDAAVADINAVLNATLANNGGPTQTHALVAGSPAVGAGATICTGYTCPATDQRGVARPQGARADIGAYEAEGTLANPVVTRALTTGVSGGGAIAVQPAPNAAGGRYADGTQVTLRATAASGSRFVGWTLNSTPAGSANPLVLTMNADQTVVATFAALPPVPSFADVPPGAFGYAEIGKLAQRGITTGCSTGEFCPTRPVTRAEMAAFLIRTITRQTAAPAGPATPTFADVPLGHPQYGFVERMFALGVTTGCGDPTATPKTYCPDSNVTRAEMAVFIIRAYP